MNLKKLKPDWLNGNPERVIVHWTAGKNNPQSPVDFQHYHLLIDGGGKAHRGKYTIADNDSTRDGRYAPHVKLYNTKSVGLALCGMLGAAKDSDGRVQPGNFPITEIQTEALIEALVDLCDVYGWLPTAKRVCGHSEVEATFGIYQPGKWDITWLPAGGEKLKNREGMDYVRFEVANRLADKRNSKEEDVDMATVEIEVPENGVKDGKKTSEYQMTVIAKVVGVIVLAAGFMGKDISPELQNTMIEVGGVILVVAQTGYSIARGMAKSGK